MLDPTKPIESQSSELRPTARRGRCDYSSLADSVLDGSTLERSDALRVLVSTDDELLAVLDAAFVVRKRTFGRTVHVHVLQNAKSGACSEDCGFCSQAARFRTGAARYTIKSVEEIVGGARKAHELGATTYCIVTATRAPSRHELDVVCEAARAIKQEMSLRICASLGFLDAEAAHTLAQAGVDRYNHNLETSRCHFSKVISSHTFEDRVATVQQAKAAGMEICCGGILGLGESLEDRVDLALAVRDLQVDSIPVNFLDPRPHTPLADVERMRPADCLRALAMFRFVNPDADIRVAAGREVNLRGMQSLALFAATSLFAEGYLTTDGQGSVADLAMIVDAGFEVGNVQPA